MKKFISLFTVLVFSLVLVAPSFASAAQKLIQPINNAYITAGYLNANYQKKFGFKHYGWDLTSANSSRAVWASGSGKVLATGYDNVLGNTVIVKYPAAYIHSTKTTKDLVFRYNHLASIAVSKGQSVTKDTRLGNYGNTGLYSTGPHLHFEIDTDTTYYQYSPTLGSSSNIIKAGTASTVLSPRNVLYTKVSSPDNQSIYIIGDGYQSSSEDDLPFKN
ncbi:M23 family metallopeptidase [Bacillus sp. E(2018)]|uniref:M23 family metallopeptidase n=1 Tax=Bacillus sp. E(2018) TaxID=2502239 RepID=UPI0010FA3FBB|nr:M23 family metallopeptidase [Bacillus sp. E(2018)]